MRILHIVEPLATGINTFILQLTQNIENADHFILHGIRKDSRDIDTIKADYSEDVTFIHWENAQREIRPFRDLNAYHELCRRMEEIQPDIIHLHSSKAGILGRIAAKRLGFKNVVYTPNAAAFLRTDVGKIKLSVYKLIEKLSARLPGEIISSSDSELDAYKKLNIKTQLIFNGARIKAKEVEKTSKFRIVNCGMISIQKNPLLFNEIAKHFVSNSHVEFYWIGNGANADQLDSPNIHITGWKSKNDVFDLLYSSDLYCSTSSWEGLPLAVIEGMGASLPLLLTSCSGNDNLVFGETNGFIIRTAEEAIDKINFFLEHKVERLVMAKESRKLYEQYFSDTICSKNYLNLYLRLYKNDQH